MNKKLLLILISSILTLALLVLFVIVSWDYLVGNEFSLSTLDYDDSLFTIDSPFAFIPGLAACTTDKSKMVFPVDQIQYLDDIGVSIIHLKEKAIAWEDVELKKGVYDFTKSDAEIASFKAGGATLMLTLETHNLLYGTEKCEFNFEGAECAGDALDEQYWQNWADYVEAVADRYCNDVKIYELDHELAPYGMPVKDGSWRNNPEIYAQVFYLTYNSLKKSCPNVLLATSGAQSSKIIGADFWENGFFQKVFDEFNRQGYDKFENIAINYHIWRDYEKEYSDHKEYIDVINAFISGYGYNEDDFYIISSSMGGNIEDEAEQANYIIKSYVSSGAKGQDLLIWNYIVESFSPQVAFIPQGLINNPCEDGVDFKKLGYYTYKLMVKKLKGSDWNNIETIINGKDNVYAYKFIKKDTGKPVWVVWWDYFNDTTSSKIISLDVGNINSVKITEAVPKYESGKEVTDYSTAFNTETKAVNSSKVQITLTETPVFIEEK